MPFRESGKDVVGMLINRDSLRDIPLINYPISLGNNRAMTPHHQPPPTGTAAPRGLLPVLLVLFVGSGCAALIYEVVWLQLLQLVIGSTAVSVGVLLATFMGGMCVGSLLLPRLVSDRWHRSRLSQMPLVSSFRGRRPILSRIVAMPTDTPGYCSWENDGYLGRAPQWRSRDRQLGQPVYLPRSMPSDGRTP